MDDIREATRAFFRAALAAKGWTAYRLAKKAGVSATTITRLLNNPDYKFTPKIETLAKISTASGVEVPVMLGLMTIAEQDFEAAQPKPVRGAIPVIGDIRAGSFERIPDDPVISEYLHIDVPDYAGARLFALRVTGRSMDLIYPDGTYVVLCSPVDAGIREGDRVVVRRPGEGDRYETTLKEVARGQNGVIVLQPRSSDPAHQVPIILPVRRDEAVDVGIAIIGVVVAAYRNEGRGKGPLLML